MCYFFFFNATATTEIYTLSLHDALPISLRVHANYSIRNCNQDPEKLQALLLNPVHHYQHQHDGCPTTSRCRVDPNYEPSKVVLRSPVAIKLLQNAIERCNLYKNAQLYCHNLSTVHVETFNNCLNVYQAKRIAFSDKAYKIHSLITVSLE